MRQWHRNVKGPTTLPTCCSCFMPLLGTSILNTEALAQEVMGPLGTCPVCLFSNSFMPWREKNHTLNWPPPAVMLHATCDEGSKVDFKGVTNQAGWEPLHYTIRNYTILYYALPIAGPPHQCNILTHQRGAICPAEVILYCLVIQPDPLVVLCVYCGRKKCWDFIFHSLSVSITNTHHVMHSQLTKCCSSGVMMLTRWAFRSRQRCSASTHISLSEKCR